jgi:alkanesulfonate monooxygenase SsuD/methylene tetrahydromethanopterin reductase-like flavin-dependent oxidoreductase (luciferase family)
MGRCWREFLLPLYLGLGLGSLLKIDPSMPDEAIDLEYRADNLWLVGSPKTIAADILELQQCTGGFGYLLLTSYDSTNERGPWERSLRLLSEEVLPVCQRFENREVVIGGRS